MLELEFLHGLCYVMQILTLLIAQCQMAIQQRVSMLHAAARRHAPSAAWLFLLQFVAYSYLFTTLTLSDHTFPNIWRYPYPSFKTLGEGRWMADLLIAAQGGSGVPSLQMVCAALLQALNSILLANLIGIKSRVYVLLLGGVLCLYPLFLDYYSFAIDHLSFVLADTLCLLGALTWLRAKRVRTRILGSSLLFAIAIGIYGAKIALVSLLLLVGILLRLSDERIQSPSAAILTPSRDVSFPLREIALAAGSLIAGVVLTLFIAKLTITYDLGSRTHINGAAEAFKEIIASYRETYRYFRFQIGGLGRWGTGIVTLVMLLGSASLLARVKKIRPGNLITCMLVMALIPIALQAPWIINNEAWRHAGRIQSANGYLIVFLLGCIFRFGSRLRPAGIGLASILIYFFFVHATQQTNYILMKSTYELNFMNRLASRVESLVANPESKTALVVVGRIPPLNISSYVRHPDKAVHITESETFADYRQVEFLNFFLGRKILRMPNPSEVSKALELASSGLAPWPSPQSVAVLGDSIVVIMQKPSNSTQTTRTGKP